MGARRLPEPSDDFDRKTLANVEEYGWSVLSIENGPGESDPEFCYSVGIYHTLGEAEVLVMGLDRETRHGLVNGYGEAIRRGRRFAAGSTADGLANVPVRLVGVPRRLYPELVGYAGWFYGGSGFPLLAMAWPDEQGRFPGDPGCDPSVAAEQRLPEPG